MTLSRIWHGVLWLCIYNGVVLASSGQEQDNSMDAVARRLESLQNVVVEFSVDSRYLHVPEIDRIVAANPALRVPADRIVTRQFSFLDGQAKYIETNSGEYLKTLRAEKKLGIEQAVFAYPGDRLEQSYKSDGRQLQGAIDYVRDLPKDSIIDEAIGLRLCGSNGWDTKNALKAGKSEVLSDSRIKVSTRDTSGQLHERVYDPALKHALTMYKVFVPGQSHPAVVFENADFREVGGLMLPYRVKRTIYDWREGSAHPLSIFEATITKYDINSLNNTSAEYHIRWPPGTKVFDRRLRLWFVTVEDGQLRDEFIVRIAEKRLAEMGKGGNAAVTTAPTTASFINEGSTDIAHRNVESKKQVSANWWYVASAVIVTAVAACVVLAGRRMVKAYDSVKPK